MDYTPARKQPTAGPRLKISLQDWTQNPAARLPELLMQ